jgi:hypothetical protein
MSKPSFETLSQFAQTSISTQLDIANRVRQMQNRDYVLFDKDFHRVSVVRVGNYRVEVDTFGRQGILCRAAQDRFTCKEYLYYLQRDPIMSDVKVIGDKVFLTAKSAARSTLVTPPPSP